MQSSRQVVLCVDSPHLLQMHTTPVHQVTPSCSACCASQKYACKPTSQGHAQCMLALEWIGDMVLMVIPLYTISTVFFPELPAPTITKGGRTTTTPCHAHCCNNRNTCLHQQDSQSLAVSKKDIYCCCCNSHAF